MKYYIKRVAGYGMVGSLGLTALMIMNGCEQRHEGESDAFTRASQKQGAFVVVEETAPGTYKIAEEYPAEHTRVILRKLDGTEKILSKEELDALVAEEAKKIEANQSALTNPQLAGGGMSLGEVILASAVGTIIGGWIGGRLFNNPTYQKTRQRGYKSPSAYRRSVESFNKPRSTASKKASSCRRSGFFGGRSGTARSGFSGFGA